jgi:Intein splicing domain/LAGLIDADG-like domain
VIPRTPVVRRPPLFLLRGVRPEPTPVIDGAVARPLTEVLGQPATDAEIAASAELTSVGPHFDPKWTQLSDEILRSSCALFANEMIRGPVDPPYRGKFLLGRHHLEWDELIGKYNRLNILAARDHGKCRVAGSLLQAADGRRVPVEQWRGGDVVAYDERACALKPAHAGAARMVGRSVCYRVVTRTGRTETVADWHRFATISGWVSAEDLVVGTRIGVPRTLPTLANQRWLPGAAWLAGLVIGDGGLRTSSTGLTISNDAVLAAAVDAAANQGWEVTGDGIGFRLSSRWEKQDSPMGWFRDFGLAGCLSTEKRIPDEVFELHVEEIAELIAGWLDSGGHINPHGGGAVELYTASEGLARDGLHLLTRLGVVAVLSQKRARYKSWAHWSWRLTIRGPSIVRLARQVRLRGARGAKLRKLAARQERKRSCGTIDLLPSSVLGKSSGYSGMTREKVRRLSRPGSRARQLADAEILWDEVVEVECVGEREVYGLQVDRYKTYVGQDIISHNTFFWTMAYPIWMAGWVAPGQEGYIFSATQVQASALLAKVREELLTNPRLAHLVPYTRDRKWSSKQLTLRNGSVIKARGFDTKIRGGHPRWCVCDDILNDEDMYSETVRRRNTEYFLSAIANMMHPDAQLIVVGTPFHFKDLYGVLADREHVEAIARELGVEKAELSNYVFECRKYPARDPETGELLFPERYNEKRLAMKRIEMKTAARFAREFLVNPMSDEASLFPERLFQQPGMRLPYVLGLGWEFWEKRGCLRYSGVDIAMSAETGGDFFVIFTVAVDKMGSRWLANIRRAKGLPFHEQIELIKDEYYLLRPSVIHIEANQAQRVWTDEVQRTTSIPVRRFFTLGIGGRQPKNPWKKGATNVSVNKHHLDRGVPSIRMSLETAKWRIPRGDANSIELTDHWIGEMGQIGWIDGKVQTAGEHDDVVMACWMASTAVDMGGANFFEFTGEAAKPAAAPLLGAPAPPKAEAHDYVAQERLALAACQRGARVVIERESYLIRVRSAMRRYADNSVQAGEHKRAANALQEIRRLDTLFDVRAADLDNPESSQYIDSWKPDESAPTADDLGIDS